MTNLAKTILLSFRSPRQAAAAIFARQLPLATSWMALTLTAVLVVLVIELAFRFAPPPDPVDPASVEAMLMALTSTPLRFAGLELASLAAFGLAIHLFGRWAGGRGSLANALLLVAWFQVILLVVVLALTALGLILPPAAGLLALALPVLVGWMLTQFVMELHGFTSAWRVLFGILGGYVAVVIALSLVLAAVGFGG